MAHRFLPWTVLLLAATLPVLNQHRLQAWHWLFLVLVAQTQIVHKDHKTFVRRITFAAVYIFAALSRIGPGIADGVSVQMLSTVFRSPGVSHLLTNDTFIFAACAAMSLIECSVGVGLLFAGTRRFAVPAAMLMHASLIGILGPWGLNHHWGVVLWNVFFICAIPLVFSSAPQNAHEASNQSSPKLRHRPGTIVVILFVVATPLSGLFSIADNWPSWQLYSPRPEVVRLFVKSSATEQLPETVRPFVGQPAPLQDWCPVQIHRWCLETVQTPMYPEDRFQLGIILWLIQDIDPKSVRVTIDSAGSPYWTDRKRTELNGADQVLARANQHLLNSTAVRF